MNTARKSRKSHKRREGGYVHCACRDCFEIAISGHGEPALCHECADAGCDDTGCSECESEHAYDCVEWENERAEALAGAPEHKVSPGDIRP